MTFNDMAQLIGCDRCAAAAGEWCRTRTGRRATYLHCARTWVVQQVWIEGFHEGQVDAVRAVDSKDQWSVRYLNQIRERVS